MRKYGFPPVVKHMPSLVLYCEQRHGRNKPLKNYSNQIAPSAPAWVKSGVMFELYIRSFTPEGTIKAASLKLADLKSLGVNIVWLMPVCPIGQEGRKGYDGSPYAIRDFRAVNPEYGSQEDLRELIRKAHHLGLKVILGMVPHHGSNDNQLKADHPDWFMRDSSGQFTRKVNEWSDIMDFNYENSELQNYMKETFLFWINKFDVDGFRMDVAGMLPINFWKETIPLLREAKDDIFLLAEWEKPEMILAGFNADYDWTFLHYLKKWKNGEISFKEVMEMILTRDSLYPQNSIPMRFLENHDEERAMKNFGVENMRLLATLLFTLPGLPLIYNGQERGLFHRPSLFDKDPLDRHSGNAEIEHLYLKLIALRKANSALQNGKMEPILCRPTTDSIQAFVRKNEEQTVLVIVNAGTGQIDDLRVYDKLEMNGKDKIEESLYQASMLNLREGTIDHIFPKTSHVFVMNHLNRRK